MFFSRAPYCRSLLESKSAVFSGLQRSTADLDASLDLTDVRTEIDGHFREFNQVLADANSTEQVKNFSSQYGLILSESLNHNFFFVL